MTRGDCGIAKLIEEWKTTVAEKWTKTWTELNELLNNSLNGLRASIHPDQASIISEYLEHREYGLAYECLIETIEDNHLVPDTATMASLTQAAKLMNIEA